MSIKPLKVQFNGGELSPWLNGRTDIAKFDKTAKLCRNFIPLAEGSLKRRGGTKFAAKTRTESALTFHIYAEPTEAVVMINDVRQRMLKVARGDSVSYEVFLDGYAPIMGKMTVTQDTVLNINLVSQTETKTLTITATPDTALIKIAGVERSSYTGFKNETVSYMVTLEGYTLVSDSVVLDDDKNITVQLVPAQDEETSIEYGDWGVPKEFVACSVYGHLTTRKKCFMIRFSNGYLPVLFNYNKAAPDDSDFNPNLFVYTEDIGYNAVVYKDANHPYELAVVKWAADAIRYYTLNDELIWGIDNYTMYYTGWPIGEYFLNVAVYSTYEGGVSGVAVRAYFKGELVWTLKGRNNG